MVKFFGHKKSVCITNPCVKHGKTNTSFITSWPIVLF